MELKRITIDLKDAYLDFAKEWQEYNEEITPFSAQLQGLSFEEFVEQSAVFETNAPKPFVNATTFYLISENKIIGAINIRHELNDYLLNYAGHIGYGIRPSQRRNGYAKQMLQMIIPFLKELNLRKILITCDENNIASSKTIKSIGGVFENNILNPDSIITNRYWVNL